MEFIISRASDFMGSKSPYKKAYKKDNFWMIEIKDLKELNNFIDKNGKIILYRGDGDVGKEICIYDDYVE